MLYVGIDQHKRHLTVHVRDDRGEMTVRRRVQTRWEEVDSFLESLLQRSLPAGGHVAIMEVCGFNGRLVERPARWGCHRVYVVAAPPRVRNKTDRRDAAKLSEMLWINRERIAQGQRLLAGPRDLSTHSGRAGGPTTGPFAAATGKGTDADQESYRGDSASAQPGAGMPDQRHFYPAGLPLVDPCGASSD